MKATALQSDGSIASKTAITGASVKSNISAVSNGSQMVTIWSDNRDETPKTYAQNLKVTDLAVQNSVKRDFSVYPNPVTDQLSIKTSSEIKENCLVSYFL